MNLSTGQVLSHYKILGEIGRGGMGVVYEALDTTLNRQVALKVLPAEAMIDPLRLERFRREARTVAALNHPGIVTIYSVEESERIHFLTMEVVSGKTLHQLIPDTGLPLEKIFQIGIPLAEALSVAHERGIVHRDLKPSNLILTEDGRLKVLDFGLAKLTTIGAESKEETQSHTSTLATAEGKVLGTIPYMSPEQVAGKALDARSDIFSMGVILYEMAVGKRPFSGGSSAELASSILRDHPTSVNELRSDLPGHLGWVIRRCLEKDPRRRYQSALEIRNELEDLKNGLSFDSRTYPRGTSTPTIGSTAYEAAASSAGSAVPFRRDTKPSSGSGEPTAGSGATRVVSSPKPLFPKRTLIVLALIALVGLIVVTRYLMRERNPEIPAPQHVSKTSSSKPSIAILPFVNMSSNPDNEYFSDGLTEELINALVKVQGLKVPARTTVFALKGKELGVEEIGRKLGVATVLEGSVRRSGDRLRINVQLVGTADGSALWSEEYDREMKDIFAIQDEISRKIVNTLKVKLTSNEQHAIERVSTRDTKAYDFYLRGRRYFYLGGGKNYRTGKEMFHKAIKLDPKYALAYAGLADVSSFEYMYSNSTPEVLETSNAASKKALELAPDLAESHASRGLALSLSKEYNAAAQEFEKAIQLDPRLFEAYYFYARNCFIQGLREQAAHLFEQAMKMRPEDYQSPAILYSVYISLGRKDEAVAVAQKTIELAEAQLDLHPADARALYLGAGALVATGQKEKGLEWAQRAVAIDPTDTGTLYNVACLYSLEGMKDEAMGYLEKAIDNGFAQKAWVENDNDLAALRNMPRYKALLQRMK